VKELDDRSRLTILSNTDNSSNVPLKSFRLKSKNTIFLAPRNEGSGPDRILFDTSIYDIIAAFKALNGMVPDKRLFANCLLLSLEKTVIIDLTSLQA
jgi:hypothetical protein